MISTSPTNSHVAVVSVPRPSCGLSCGRSLDSRPGRANTGQKHEVQTENGTVWGSNHRHSIGVFDVESIFQPVQASVALQSAFPAYRAAVSGRGTRTPADSRSPEAGLRRAEGQTT